MEQRVHIITLGVETVARAAAFYDALGWQRVTKGAPELVVYQLYGSVLGVYARAALEAEVGRPLSPGSGSMALAHNVPAREAVAPLLAAAAAAGGQIRVPARDTHWGGHGGYFEDLDGHLWEVAWNPFSPLGPEGQFRWGGWQEEARHG